MIDHKRFPDMKNILIAILGVERVSRTQVSRSPNPRQGVSTVETSLLIAMIVGSLILVFGAMQVNVSHIADSVDQALVVGERIVGEGRSGESNSTISIDGSIASTAEQTGSDLLVGIGIPTAVLALIGSFAYLMVKT